MMKQSNKNYTTLIITFILLFVLAACRDRILDTTYANADMVKHFDFKHGSYWIYRDTISGRTDSFAVSSNANFVTDGMQLLVVGVLDYSFSHTGVDTFSLECRLYKSTIDIQFARNGGFIRTDATFQYPMNITYKSYNINGANYSNIEEIDYGSDSFFINENIGLIKMVLNEPNDHIVYNFELVKYNIQL